jgi:hypothetical protein
VDKKNEEMKKNKPQRLRDTEENSEKEKTFCASVFQIKI